MKFHTIDAGNTPALVRVRGFPLQHIITRAGIGTPPAVVAAAGPLSVKAVR